MSYRIFKPSPLVRRSFLQKLFKQHPIENAVIELNNILSEVPISDITHNDIAKIENSYSVDFLSEFSLNLQEFYAVYLNFCLENNELKDNELYDLNHLSNILKLDKDIIQMLHEKIGSIAYRRAWEDATSNGILSDAEERKLKKLSQSLQLPNKMTEDIAYDVASKYIKNHIQKIIGKLEYTIEDEIELNKIAKDLHINLNIDNHSSIILSKLRQYNEVEYSELKEVAVEYPLQKNEICFYFVPNVTWYEYKHTITHSNTNDFRKCIKQAKIAAINGSTESIKSNAHYMKYVDSGTLYLTNKRVLLDGKIKSSNIRLEKIVDITAFDNGFRINKNIGKPVALNFYNSDIPNIILCKILLTHR